MNKPQFNYFKTVLLLSISSIVMASCATHKALPIAPVRHKENIDVVKSGGSKPLPTKEHDVVKHPHQDDFKNEKEYEKYIITHYAEILNTPKSYIQHNIKLYKFVDMWLGVPYRYGGSDMNGTDCSGLAKVTFNEVYQQTITRDAGSQFLQCEPINSKADLMEGDLVFFKIGSRNISHVGIYLGNGKFFHASSKGVMISDLNEKYYSRYYFKGGRIKMN